MKKQQTERSKKLPKLLLSVGFALLAVVIGVMFGPELWGYFSSQERIEATIRDAGNWGPVVFILIQALQILVAPIPGQVTGLAAGYLFGTIEGAAYSMIGSIIGFTLVFLLARKLGRPIVEYFFDKKKLDKFDYLVETKGVFAFFLIFLLPFFPDDLICYLAGLTKIPIKTLVLVSAIARLPSVLLFAFAGREIAENNLWVVVWLSVFVLAFAGLIWWKQEPLERLVKKLSK